jgi:predicted ArsR family transcriptional regulator
VTVPTTSRDGILQALKRRGEARAEELAEALGVTVSAVRQQLQALAADGLVAHDVRRTGPGRPKHVFHLTPAAEHLFPKTYGDLTNELLGHLEEEDPELLQRVFERRRVRRVADAKARLEPLATLDARVEELARILDEDGYLATVEPVAGDPDAWRVVEHNCAILEVALRYGTACGTELEFLREVLPDADVRRTEHLVAGARRCAYEVRPLTPPR